MEEKQIKQLIKNLNKYVEDNFSNNITLPNGEEVELSKYLVYSYDEDEALFEGNWLFNWGFNNVDIFHHFLEYKDIKTKEDLYKELGKIEFNLERTFIDGLEEDFPSFIWWLFQSLSIDVGSVMTTEVRFDDMRYLIDQLEAISILGKKYIENFNIDELAKDVF